MLKNGVKTTFTTGIPTNLITGLSEKSSLLTIMDGSLILTEITIGAHHCNCKLNVRIGIFEKSA